MFPLIVQFGEGAPSVAEGPNSNACALIGTCKAPRITVLLFLWRQSHGPEFERGEIGPDLFREACKFGLESLVSKRRDRPYRAGRSPDWIKVKNRSHPALERVKESFA
jgi:hypothetical protein